MSLLLSAMVDREMHRRSLEIEREIIDALAREHVEGDAIPVWCGERDLVFDTNGRFLRIEKVERPQPYVLRREVID